MSEQNLWGNPLITPMDRLQYAVAEFKRQRLATARYREQVAQRDRLYEVVVELAELKALKDKIDNHVTLPFHEARRVPEMRADYVRRKPQTWAAARKEVPVRIDPTCAGALAPLRKPE